MRCSAGEGEIGESHRSAEWRRESSPAGAPVLDQVSITVLNPLLYPRATSFPPLSSISMSSRRARQRIDEGPVRIQSSLATLHSRHSRTPSVVRSNPSLRLTRMEIPPPGCLFSLRYIRERYPGLSPRSPHPSISVSRSHPNHLVCIEVSRHPSPLLIASCSSNLIVFPSCIRSVPLPTFFKLIPCTLPTVSTASVPKQDDELSCPNPPTFVLG